MKKKILLIKENGWIWTFLLEDGEVAEIHCASEKESQKRLPSLGDIYIGKVQNIVHNLGAAFIDIGEISCYYDLSQVSHAIFTAKCGKNPICIGDELLVQISREAVKTKAPTVSSNLSFTGRYVVLTSGNPRIGTSAKLPRLLREEYKERLEGLKNEDYGLIVRTNAKDVPFETVLEEISKLEERFRRIKKAAQSRTCFSCLESAAPTYLMDLKNVYAEGLTEIIVEDGELYEEVRAYFYREQPEFLPLLRRYDDPQLSLYALYGIRSVLDHALGRTVWLKSGGYLVIQPTEAMTVIDVNSGKNVLKKNGADSAFKTNLEAAKEIARQLRLRNLSGIIIVDFINMEEEQAIQQLLSEFRRCLAKDPIQATLVDVTALQLVEVTRKKVRRPLHECMRERAGSSGNPDKKQQE